MRLCLAQLTSATEDVGWCCSLTPLGRLRRPLPYISVNTWPLLHDPFIE